MLSNVILYADVQETPWVFLCILEVVNCSFVLPLFFNVNSGYTLQKGGAKDLYKTEKKLETTEIKCHGWSIVIYFLIQHFIQEGKKRKRKVQVCATIIILSVVLLLKFEFMSNLIPAVDILYFLTVNKSHEKT